MFQMAVNQGGRIQATDRKVCTIIELPLRGMGFTGTAYVVGIKTTGLLSYPDKPWIKCKLSTGVATEDTGPPPNPFPEDEEWYEKANTSGDIHVVRA
jgi:hypothetical protein